MSAPPPLPDWLPYDKRRCLTCNDGRVYDRESLATHLRHYHGVQVEGRKFACTITGHIDGRGWELTNSEWDFDGIKVSQDKKTQRVFGV